MKGLAQFFSGKKTVIAGVASTTIAFATIKGWIDGDTATYLLSMSTLLLGVGVTHKVQKFYKEKPVKDETVG